MMSTWLFLTRRCRRSHSPFPLCPSLRMFCPGIRRWGPSLYCARVSQPFTPDKLACKSDWRNILWEQPSNLPNFGGPRAGTTFPYIKNPQHRYLIQTRCHKRDRYTNVLPWKIRGSSPGPFEKANVHTASAERSSKESSILLRPSCPRASRNDLLYVYDYGYLFLLA